jgi:hypothetical protein
MNRKTFCVLVALAVLVLLVAGCSHQPVGPNPFGDPRWKGHDLSPGSGPLACMEHMVRYGSAYAGMQLSTVFYTALILLVPWVVILLVPGVIFGAWEMKVESLLILGFFGLLWWKSQMLGDLGLVPWLIIVDMIPAAIMFFWSSEAHKTALFGAFSAILVLKMLVDVCVWIGDGLVLASISTMLCIAALVGMVVLCRRKEALA